MTPSEPQAWVDGELTARSQARVSIDDFGARYGAVCFETMRVHHSVVFRLDAHLDRLEHGLALLHVAAPPRDRLRGAIDETLAANGLSDAAVRLAVSAGAGHVPDLRAATGPTVTVTVDPLPPRPAPARLRIASVRVDEHRAWRAAKVGQYLPYLLAREEARSAGADDALLLNYAGHVAEASTANVVLLLDGALVTPDAASGALPGITAAAVLEAARGLGIAVEEAAVTLDHVARAGAVLLTSSVAGIRDVAEVEGGAGVPSLFRWHAPAQPPDVVTTLRRAYESLVLRECVPAG